jgi:hypothetical protein
MNMIGITADALYLGLAVFFGLLTVGRRETSEFTWTFFSAAFAGAFAAFAANGHL